MNNTLILPMAAFVAFALLPVANAAESILLSAGDFGILGGTAVTSTGTVGTIISNGDVGSAVTVTGFPPAQVVNGSIVLPGPVVGQALLDLGTLRVGLSGMPVPLGHNLSGSDLGGMTLTPGVYKFDVAAALNGALFLDAEGQNNVFWVFNIGTSLITSLGSSVTLINPGTNLGSDDGIFWNAETAAITIGANSQLLGNYLAATSITFGGTVSGSGRALASAGVTLDVNVIDPFGGPGGGDWSGGLMYNDVGAIVPSIPELAAGLWLLPIGALGLALWRRRNAAAKRLLCPVS